jgi:hypothetical protein
MIKHQSNSSLLLSCQIRGFEPPSPSSCVDSELVSAAHALIEDSLTLIGASHLSRHVVHLLGVALWAVLIHYDFFHTLVGLGPLLSCLHPLFPLIEFFPGDDFIAD